MAESIKLVLTALIVGIALGDATAQNPDGTKSIRSVRMSDGRIAEDRLIMVEENRHAPGSRTISVSYSLIHSRRGNGLPPVFVLPGGPGKLITLESVLQRFDDQRYSLPAEIAAYSEHRDVFIINQRGVAPSPAGPALPKYWRAPPPDVTKPRSHSEFAKRLPTALRDAMSKCESQGFDLRGYDIDHLVDDVDAIRVAHGHDRIALRGASFGSQWALAYLARYPAHVERMTLSGVEPVDYGYDSADGVWNVITRLESELQDEGLPGMPQVGLTEAIKAIVARLEEDPARVKGKHPRRGYVVDVTIGVDDFRHYLLRPVLSSQMHSRKMLSYLPKFVAEIYAKDYDYLAAKVIDDRPEIAMNDLALTLVDNSIGVSEQRLRVLKAEEARRWLGDLNWFYTTTRSECRESPSVDKLRLAFESPVPVLLIQGTYDLATPFENAQDELRRFPNGRLLTVKGGTHAATFHAASVDDRFLSYLDNFMRSTDAFSALKQIPEVIELPPLDFALTEGDTLFQMLIQQPNKN